MLKTLTALRRLFCLALELRAEACMPSLGPKTARDFAWVRQIDDGVRVSRPVGAYLTPSMSCLSFYRHQSWAMVMPMVSHTRCFFSFWHLPFGRVASSSIAQLPWPATRMMGERFRSRAGSTALHTLAVWTSSDSPAGVMKRHLLSCDPG
ncbi:hypothetical protein F5884DRAFT_865445 [Xylogone sp. PMI_703]|nr:hypothetical protein F5884DRAFT_865445 [Xylogone sp. PMI_703]